MSIYATLGEIGIKRFGDEKFVEILIQGVPPHIEYTGPKWEFLPLPIDPEGTTMRAVFFVERGEEKGTPRNGQEYAKPLLAMKGCDYETIGFAKLLNMLEEALDVRYGKRPWGVVITPDGEKKNIPGPND